MALNGGPYFTFSPAISLVAYCDTQDEVDSLWQQLTADGQEEQCDWLIDRFGVSWQIVPRELLRLLNSVDQAAAQRAFTAMMTMKKIDSTAVQRAYDESDFSG